MPNPSHTGGRSAEHADAEAAHSPKNDLIPVELDFRATDGVEVSLLWHKRTDSLTVFVFDTRTEETFELDVESRVALDAFQHPYAYAAARGVDFREPVRV
jgi:hypothetical protein